jgi:hypothetical protein
VTFPAILLPRARIEPVAAAVMKAADAISAQLGWKPKQKVFKSDSKK